MLHANCKPNTTQSYLTPGQAVIVLLHDVFDFTAPETASILHTTEGAIKSSLHRARAKLHDANARNEQAQPDAVAQATTPQQERMLTRYIKAFNDRDPDAIAALLAPEVEIDIVNVSQELGRDTARRHSLEGWSRTSTPMRAEYHILWGKPVVVWLEMKQEDLSYAITNLIRFQMEDGLMTRMKGYYFCPELLRKAGEVLNLPVRSNGYHFQMPR